MDRCRTFNITHNQTMNEHNGKMLLQSAARLQPTSSEQLHNQVPYKLLFPDSKDPERQRETDAGMDLFAREFSYTATGVCNIHLGVAVNIPEGFVGLLRPRSSVRNHSYSVASSCVIDAGYTGELILPLREHDEIMNGGTVRYYHKGDRCAQLVILPLPRFEWVQVEEFSETARGEKGFGSTEAQP